MFRLVAASSAPRRVAPCRAYATAKGSEVKLVRYHKFGVPSEVLKVETEVLPPVSNGQVKIQMIAAPINPADLNIVEGTYGAKVSLPAVAGLEGVGQVTDVGAGVKDLNRGDWVISASSPGFGTWRTQAVVNADLLTRVPNTIPAEYAACIAVNPCDVIVQNGANSTVGVSVVQLAKSKGIRTINILRNRPNSEEVVTQLKAYGGDVVATDDTVHTREFQSLIKDLGQPKLALNCVGGESAVTISRMLSNGGTMVTYGGMSRRPVTIPTSQLIFKDITHKGFWLTRWVQTHSREERKAMIDEVAKLIAAGKLKLWLERHAFSDFSQALARAQQPFRDRKVVMMMDK